jgi:hypothetical protein
MKAAPRLSLIFLLGVGALTLSACNVANSYHVPPMAASGGRVACSSALGHYAIPRAFVHVRIGQTNKGENGIVTANGNPPVVEVVRHPDPAFIYCLNYDASPTADDQINIIKAPDPSGAKTSFLGAITINATDQTSYILQALIEAARIVATGRALKEGDSVKTLADFEYDPFDQTESAEINRRLSALGFCLILDGYTYSEEVSPDQYCSMPSRFRKGSSAYAIAYAEYEDPSSISYQTGIFYKPRLPYRLSIYQKGGRGAWLLQTMMTINLENISPVFALDVERTFFAGRRTYFEFDQGALTKACVAKGSELLGFVDVPLAIAKDIVAVPSQIVQFRVTQLGSEKSLVDAQDALLKVQQQHLAILTNPASSATVGSPNVTPVSPVSIAPTFPAGLAEAQSITTNQTLTDFTAGVCAQPGSDNSQASGN